MALAWAPDGVHLAAVTGDNAHTVQVFRVDLQGANDSACIFSSQGHRGEPPQVFGVTWNPFLRTVRAGTRELQPSALAFVTYGVKHIRFWRFDAQADTYLGGAFWHQGAIRVVARHMPWDSTRRPRPLQRWLCTCS